MCVHAHMHTYERHWTAGVRPLVVTHICQGEYRADAVMAPAGESKTSKTLNSSESHVRKHTSVQTHK